MNIIDNENDIDSIESLDSLPESLEKEPKKEY